MTENTNKPIARTFTMITPTPDQNEIRDRLIEQGLTCDILYYEKDGVLMIKGVGYEGNTLFDLPFDRSLQIIRLGGKL